MDRESARLASGRPIGVLEMLAIAWSAVFSQCFRWLPVSFGSISDGEAKGKVRNGCQVSGWHERFLNAGAYLDGGPLDGGPSERNRPLLRRNTGNFIVSV